MGNGALAIGPKLPRPSSTLPKRTDARINFPFVAEAARPPKTLLQLSVERQQVAGCGAGAGAADLAPGLGFLGAYVNRLTVHAEYLVHKALAARGSPTNVQ